MLQAHSLTLSPRMLLFEYHTFTYRWDHWCLCLKGWCLFSSMSCIYSKEIGLLVLFGMLIQDSSDASGSALDCRSIDWTILHLRYASDQHSSCYLRLSQAQYHLCLIVVTLLSRSLSTKRMLLYKLSQFWGKHPDACRTAERITISVIIMVSVKWSLCMSAYRIAYSHSSACETPDLRRRYCGWFVRE